MGRFSAAAVLACTLAVVATLMVAGLPAASNAAAIVEMSFYSDDDAACNTFSDCQDCLFDSTGAKRKYCGWCHSDIIFQNSTIGTQCADIRENWKCPSIFDTYQCSRGFMCNYNTGQCNPSTSGSGIYSNDTQCMQHCFPTPDVYICNTTTYTCDKCPNHSDPKCAPQDTACANCNSPANATFRCDKTDPKNPVCVACHIHDPHAANCTDFHNACDKCQNQPPSPPTPPPPPPPPGPHPSNKNYTCNLQTLQCEESTTGESQQLCSSKCSNSTPPEYKGLYRGIQVQKGYVDGEFDFDFENATVTIRDPSGNEVHGNVTVQGEPQILLIDGPNAGKVIKFYMRTTSNGPETTSSALAMSAPGGEVDQELAKVMAGTNGEQMYVVTECNSWKAAECDFKPAFSYRFIFADGAAGDASAEKALAFKKSIMQRMRRDASATRANARKAFPAAVEPLPELYPEFGHMGEQKWSVGATDPCNQFSDCSSCINAREGDLQCGWCMGGPVTYNATGESKFQCAGYQAGVPPPFMCPMDFRTEQCDGFSCNWNASTPQCFHSDNGQYSTQSDCEKTCQKAQYAKCNPQTKQCENCTMGEPGCMEKNVCDQSCNLPHAKCNNETHQCISCDQASDPNCTQTISACQESCKADNTAGICDVTTGQCVPCDPSKHEHGCVSNCNATCTFGGLYGCNMTDHTCVQGLGQETLPDCVNDCVPHNHTGDYGCDWSNPENPQCIKGKGKLNQTDCERNCQEPSFSMCNYTTGQCQSCSVSDPDCKYTKNECAVFCHKSSLIGIFRGIQINKGFTRGEWDFSFDDSGNAAFQVTGTTDQVYKASTTQDGSSSQGTSIIFHITAAPSNGPINVQPGDVLSGLYVTNPGQNQMFNFMYLALGTQQSAASTFDEGMTAFEWVLTACAQSDTNCSFQGNAVPTF